ncbi:MAG TPA: protein kinase [Acidimicrobiales bacterium]
MAVTPPPPGSSPAAGVHAGALLGGRYRLDEQIASGGMAQVWLGIDEVLRRAIAVKVLHHHLAADETFVARFRHEAIAVARLSHPAIVNVYDTCSDDGVEAIVMELVRGETLRNRLDRGPVDPWHATDITVQVAGALAVAHAAGLVHRDIKPANILLSDDGRVKVGDFGIAKAVESADLTQTGSFVGTAKYLAPEQVEGNPVDGRTDLYSLGIVLYEMLCGRVPFEADSSSATALARLRTDPRPPRAVNQGVPRELEAVTMRLLARDPDSRYDTADELRAELLAASSGHPVEPHPGGAPPVPPPPVPAPGADAPAGVLTGRAGAVPPPPPLDGTLATSPSGYDLQEPPTPAEEPVSFVETERRWLVPTSIVVLIAVALAVAGLLIGRSSQGIFGGGDEETDEPDVAATTGEPLGITGSIDFDPPPGDREEHSDEAEAGLAFDGDTTTGWSTERYDFPDWGGGLKEGVGLILELEDVAAISSVQIDSPDQGWAAEIYVADEAQTGSLEEWGDPVAEIGTDMTGGGEVEVDLEDASGGAVLVWLTSHGDGSKVTLSEVRLIG